MSLRPGQLGEPSSRQLDLRTEDVSRLTVRLARAVAQAGGRALVVGGFVRDALLGHSGGDLDLEVYGLSAQELEGVAASLARTRPVGRDFGILKVGPLDVSLPRADRTPGRHGFLGGRPDLSLREASRRRDFTLNALAWDPLTGAVYDPWGGAADLLQGRLEVVDPTTFVEDPLRALRMVQFVARFPVEPTERTLTLCRTLAPQLRTLPRERHFEELRKLLLRGRRIAHALHLARSCGLIEVLWPELEPTPDHAPSGGPAGHAPSPPPGPESGPLPTALWDWRGRALELRQVLPSRLPEAELSLQIALLLEGLEPPPAPPSPPTVGTHATGPGPNLYEALSDRALQEGLPHTARFLQRLTEDRRLQRQVLELRASVDWMQRWGGHGCPEGPVRWLSTRVCLARLLELERRRARSSGVSGGGLEYQAALEAVGGRLGLLEGPPSRLVQGAALEMLGRSWLAGDGQSAPARSDANPAIPHSQGAASLRPGPGLGHWVAWLYARQLDGDFRTEAEGLELVRAFLQKGQSPF